MYTRDRPGAWSDRGSAVILPDPMHYKIRNIFLRVAARAWVSFTRRTDALYPLKQNYGHFALRGSREGKLFS